MNGSQIIFGIGVGFSVVLAIFGFIMWM